MGSRRREEDVRMFSRLEFEIESLNAPFRFLEEDS
jgi:hypothetical protein